MLSVMGTIKAVAQSSSKIILHPVREEKNHSGPQVSEVLDLETQPIKPGGHCFGEDVPLNSSSVLFLFTAPWLS